MRFLTSLIRWMKTGNIALASLTMMAIITVSAWMMLNETGQVVAQETGTEEKVEGVATAGRAPESVWGLGLLAAAISTSVSAIAAGIAVSIVGSAAMGAVAEKPEVMGRSIIFVGLAEGIAIYGLIISIMILGKLQ